jgi:hypothetical protein
LGTYSNRQLQKEWYTITWDSYSVGIRRVEVNKDNYSRKGIWEVFKYAVKFSKLEIPQLAEVMEIQQMKKYHFFSTYGIFRGRKLEKADWIDNKLFVEKSFEYCKGEFQEPSNMLYVSI